MNSQNIMLGDIIHDVSNNTNFRYLFPLPEQGDFVVFRLMDYPCDSQRKHRAVTVDQAPQERPPLPSFWSIPRTLESLEKGELEIVKDVTPIRDASVWSRAEREFHDRIKPVLQKLGHCEPEIYYPETRFKLIRAAVSEFNLTRQTIFTYLRLYWAAGKDLRKIHVKYAHCGAPGKPRISSEKKLGRPRRQALREAEQHGVGINVSMEARECIRVLAYDGLKAGWNISKCYRNYLIRHHWQDLLQPDGSIKPDYSRHLTREQFNFHYHSFVQLEDQLRAKLQPHTFEQRTRAQHKGVRQAGLEVGRIYQVDGTKLNIPLVRASNRNEYIGTAIAILVTEVESGVIVGCWVGYEHEVYEAVAMALVVTVTNKVEYCKRYGVTIEDWQWSVEHFCQSLVVDRGSAFFQPISDCILRALGNNPLINTPAFRADLKGVVENINGLMKAWLANNIDTAYRGKGMYAERGTPDPRHKGQYTLEEVTRAFLHGVIAQNTRINRSFPTLPELEGVPTTPIHIWNWALENHRHRLTRKNPDELELLLLPRTEATITTEGIYVQHELYYAPEEGRPAWFRQMEQKKARVQVIQNRYCMDYVYLPHPECPGQYVRCSLLPKSQQFRGMTLAEVVSLRRKRSVTNALYEPTQLSTQLKAEQAGARDRKHATREKALMRDPNQTKADIVSNARDRRNAEKKVEHRKLAAHLATLGQGMSASTPETEKVDDYAYPELDEDIV